MFHALQILLQVLAILLVATAMALALALELPGKLRLAKEPYLVIQTIYYPGFTIGGASEPIGIITLLVLAIVTPTETAAFWLTLGALAALVAMHTVYWLATHPVNNFWLKDFRLQGASARFFGLAATHTATGTPDWIMLRNQWEF